jgi:hypothetical protein
MPGLDPGIHLPQNRWIAGKGERSDAVFPTAMPGNDVPARFR